MAKCGTFSRRPTKSEPCWLGEPRVRSWWGEKKRPVGLLSDSLPLCFLLPTGRSRRSHCGLTCSPTAVSTTPSGRMGPGETQEPQVVVTDSHRSLLWAFFLPSMETLSDMFELDLPTVHSIISKMIIHEELMVRARGGARAGGVIESSAWRRLIRPLLCLPLIRPP